MEGGSIMITFNVGAYSMVFMSITCIVGVVLATASIACPKERIQKYFAICKVSLLIGAISMFMWCVMLLNAAQQNI